MRFNSFIYWAFLAGGVALLWLLPARWRKGWLLVLSYAFYGSWHYPYLGLLIGTAALGHWGGVWMVRGNRRHRGRWVLAGHLLLLALFKYLDWGIENTNAVAAGLGLPLQLPLPHWVLPLGISFYLFQSMSYVVDLMRKRERIHRFWDFQLYIAYFPQLIAGPIMRAKEFLPQVEARWSVSAGDIQEGLRLVITGLFVKIVLADGLAPRVDAAFARTPNALGTMDVAVMAVAFGLQVYFDFSAYSRIAIGSARLCGLRLVENFDFPYSATSPVDFWARWHMSLSRWIRDYLFFPLTGKRTDLGSLCRAALVAMTLCGIWHGAGWTFVLWGVYHGVLIAGYHTVTGRRRGVPRPLAESPRETPGAAWRRAWERVGRSGAILLTFGLVSAGWLFFRAQDVGQALALWGRLLTPWEHLGRALPGTFYLHGAVLTVVVWAAPGLARRWRQLQRWTETAPALWPRRLYAVAEGVVLGWLLILCLIYLRGQQTFVYFQF